jgi:hypothetical protein
MRKVALCLGLIAVGLLTQSCGGYGDTASVVIYPETVELKVNQTQEFEGFVKNMLDPTVKWSVEESWGGSVSAHGLYTAPSSTGTYHVVATSNSDSTMHNRATVTVVASE